MKKNNRTICEAEREVFGNTHAEIGACLMGTWGIHTPIVEALAFHHNPSKCRGNSFAPLTAVHFADIMTSVPKSDNKEDGVSKVDIEYIKRIGMDNRLQDWCDICKDEYEADCM